MAAAPLTNGTPFSEHLLGKMTSRLAVDPHGPTLAVKNQLLLAKGASPVPISPGAPLQGFAVGVAQYFAKHHIAFKKLRTVFDGLPNPGGYDDVDIIEYVVPPGSAKTVFDITHDLRAPAKGALATSPSLVSPNHVLIPAPHEYWCPYGPPSHLPHAPVSYPGGIAGVDITVIDSGYIWDPSWSAAGSGLDNPLDHLTPDYLVNEAEWLSRGPSGSWAWAAGTKNVVDANGDNKLDALAGHANFVAGVIAQHCEMPNIQIWNHNSAFLYNHVDNFSTEAAICRSLVMSQQNIATPVIQIGHASPLTDNIASVVWSLAFKRVDGPGLVGLGGSPSASSRNLVDDVVLTCPAGNQGLVPPTPPAATPPGMIPRFPAALHSAYPFVKGVASVSDTGVRSPWSNHGQWVVCSAIGEEVASTFLYVDMHVEDAPATSAGAPPPPQNFENNSWATWNGTSFASPKIAGLIAARLDPQSNTGPTASQAWTSLAQTFGTVQNNDVGFIFLF